VEAGRVLYLSLHLLGQCLMVLYRPAEAVRPLQDAIAIGRQLVEAGVAGFPATELGKDLQMLGQCYLQTGRLAEADQCFQQASSMGYPSPGR
jgi:tetratricopeptide (TPR) repeat protein